MIRNTRRRFGLLAATLFLVLLLTPEGRAGAPSRPVLRVHPLRGPGAARPQAANKPARTDPRVSDLAERLRQTAAQARAAAHDVKGQGRTRQREAKSALQAGMDSALDVQFRPHVGTPMLIRGGVLEPAGPVGARASQRDAETARSFLRRNRELLGLDDPDAELTLVGRRTDETGRRHLRFTQSFEGLPVWPADVLVHLDAAGNVDLLNGAFVRTPRRIKGAPRVDAAQAVAAARAKVPGGEAGEAGTPELIVYAPLDRPTRLAWKIEVEVSLTSRWLVVVDARGGHVLSAFNQVNEAGRSGSGADLFGVNRPLNVWEEGGDFFLVDTSKPSFDPSSDPPEPNRTRGGIVILDARNRPPTDNPDAIPELFQITARTANGPWLRDGVSAAFGLSRTYDYFRERHNRNAIDGEGGTLFGIVRYGAGLANAFWSNGLMLFGDAQPFAGSIDVVGHEMTHGVTEKTAELIYENQPGALNEAMSDIFGENVEAFANGSPDWLKGAQLGEPIQNYRDPNAVTVLGRPLPARMGQFIPPNDPFFDNFSGRDNGGVHINSSIINHAYYQLAEGLAGAIGIRDAERIFYRALTAHLVRNSQFIDARLAAVQSAEEIFGRESVQARKTREAFDAVEIFEGTGTPEPEPFPAVQGPDSLVYVFYDPASDATYLGRFEEGLGDPPGGVQLSAFPVQPSRPSVSGDGSVVAFVNAENDVCLIASAADFDEIEECAGVPGLVHSVVMAPTGDRFAFVLRDEQGEPENTIRVIDLTTDETQTIELGAPLLDGRSVGTVAFAEIMDFTADGRFLVYDAFNVIPVAGGDDLGLWSIYAVDLQDEQPRMLVEPVPGVNIGNPSLSQTSDNYMVFDVFGEQTSDVYAVNLNTGDVAEIDTAGELLGFPGYNGDDSAVVFSREDGDTLIGSSLVRRGVQDFTRPRGNTELIFEDAFAGVIYRRGEYQGPPPATSTPTIGAPRTRTPTRTPALPGECVGDCNGNGEVTVDELIRGVNIALGSAAIEQCPEFDTNENGEITVNELIQAVNSALNGCV